MSTLCLVLLAAATSTAAYGVGVHYLRLERPFLPSLGPTLETIGVALLFFLANAGIVAIVAIAFRIFGIFVSLRLAGDLSLAGLACLQALAFQFWRYSGGTNAKP